MRRNPNITKETPKWSEEQITEIKAEAQKQFEELEKSNAMRQKLAIARILGENLIEVTEQFMEMEKIRICTGTEPPDYRRTKEYLLDAARRLTTHKDLEK